MNLITKFLLAIIALALIALAMACTRSGAPQQGANPEQAKSSTIVRASLNPAAQFYAEAAALPAEVKAGAPATIVFTVKDQKGATIKDLQVVHEKPMHLLVVSNDLAEFSHVHPEPQADGTYKVTHTFPSGGGYKLYADFTPPGAKQVVERFDMTVAGEARPQTQLVEDKPLTKTVESLTVTMFPDKPLRTGQDLMLNFAIADAQTGQPVTDLEKYLGALAHFVIINEDTTEFLHAHPMEPDEMLKGVMDHGASSKKQQSADKNAQVRTPAISAHTSFPRAGLYKVWAQFQRGGRVITVPFVFRVAEGEARDVASTDGAPAPADAIKVTVSGAGFEPSQIKVKKGQLVKLAFYRVDAKNCAGEVVFPDLKITKSLPAGETTIVEVTPKKSGELAFTCGMGMYEGALVATN